MLVVNRGYIIVRAKQPFVSWANEQEPDFELDINGEPSVYLIEEEFYEEELIVQQNFKRIFQCELDAVTDNDASFPEIKLTIFNEWFSTELGSTVIDTMKKGLDRE